MATAAVAPQTLWAPFDPRRDGPFDRRRARHLLRRAGFGAAPTEVEAAVERGLADTVAFLLAVPEERDPLGAAFTAVLAGRLAVDPVRGLQARWLRRMIETPYPLRERLTLLWHDHFATSLRKVRRAPLMARQIDTLRHHALGPFGDLVRAMAIDPAMILWLDAQKNHRKRPNENLARELFELFTLGRGHYAERDVLEAARALSGWGLEGDRARFFEHRHDPGRKTILGQTGRFDLEDVVRLALARPDAARMVATKLYETFVAPAPEPAVLEPLVARLASTGLDLRDAMDMILRSQLFFSGLAVGQRIRSPLEYALSALVALSARYDPIRLARDLEQMGLSLLQPPDVSGWKGGIAWINAQTLGARYRFAEQLTGVHGPLTGPVRFDPLVRLREAGAETPERAVDHFVETLLARAPTPKARRALVRFARSGPGGPDRRARLLVRAILTLPEAHLG